MSAARDRYCDNQRDRRVGGIGRRLPRRVEVSAASSATKFLMASLTNCSFRLDLLVERFDDSRPCRHCLAAARSRDRLPPAIRLRPPRWHRSRAGLPPSRRETLRSSRIAEKFVRDLLDGVEVLLVAGEQVCAIDDALPLAQRLHFLGAHEERQFDRDDAILARHDSPKCDRGDGADRDGEGDDHARSRRRSSDRRSNDDPWISAPILSAVRRARSLIAATSEGMLMIGRTKSSVRTIWRRCSPRLGRPRCDAIESDDAEVAVERVEREGDRAPAAHHHPARAIRRADSGAARRGRRPAPSRRESRRRLAAPRRGSAAR